MKIEKINSFGYDIEIVYQPFFDDSKPKSKQYQLIIKRNNVEYVNCYGMTYNSAVVRYKKWINKNIVNPPSISEQ